MSDHLTYEFPDRHKDGTRSMLKIAFGNDVAHERFKMFGKLEYCIGRESNTTDMILITQHWHEPNGRLEIKAMLQDDWWPGIHLTRPQATKDGASSGWRAEKRFDKMQALGWPHPDDWSGTVDIVAKSGGAVRLRMIGLKRPELFIAPPRQKVLAIG